jgi:hypothetical protein
MKNNSTVTQLWRPITLRNPEDVGDIYTPKRPFYLEPHVAKFLFPVK